MKLRSVFSFFFLSLFAAKTFAGSVDVAQWVPWHFLESQVDQIPLGFQGQQESLPINIQGWDLILKGTEVRMQGRGSHLSIDQRGLVGKIDSISVQLKVPELIIDQVITKKVAGNSLQIHIQAQCHPFNVNIPQAGLYFKAPFMKSLNSWEPVLSDLSIQLGSSAWSVSDIVCDGPQGIAQEVASQIHRAISEPQMLQENLKKWLAPRVHSIWNEGWKKLIENHSKSIQGTFIGQPESQGFFIYGSLPLMLQKNVMLPDIHELQHSENFPQLLIADEGFAALAEETLRTQYLKDFDLQKISAFKKLLSSRFIQFFVWPDLMNFSKNAIFNLTTNQKVSSFQLKNKSENFWTLQLQVGGLLRAERDLKVQDYLKWGLGLSGVVQFDVRQGDFTAKLSQQNSNLAAQFDEQYRDVYQPSTYIGKIVMEQAQKALFGDGSARFVLPKIQYQNKTFLLNGWESQRNIILMNWQE